MKTKLSQRKLKIQGDDLIGSYSIDLILPILDKGPSNAGVYRLWSPIKPGSYVGSSTTLQKRANEHWRYYQSGTQNTYTSFVNQVQLKNLEFEVLEYFPDGIKKFAPDLIAAEEKWSRYYHDKGEAIGLLHGKVWTEDRRIKARSEESTARLKDPSYLKRQIEQMERNLRWFKTKLNECESLESLQTLEV